MLGYAVSNMRGRDEDWIRASERALEHARLAGQRITHLFRLESALAYGSRPADEALRTLDALLSENSHPQSLCYRAWLLAMLGRSAEAAELSADAAERWRQLSGDDWVEGVLGHIASTNGDHEAAATHFRRFCDLQEQRSHRGLLATYSCWLGRELAKIGEYDEAASCADLGRGTGSADDIVTQMLWRQVQAIVHAQRGEGADAERLAREAVELGKPTDWLIFQGDALRDLAEVLATTGQVEAAAAAYERALDHYGRKKNVALAAQAQHLLDALRAQVRPC
jgi:tetratricopeptide (TPR) repeat protein